MRGEQRKDKAISDLEVRLKTASSWVGQHLACLDTGDLVLKAQPPPATLCPAPARGGRSGWPQHRSRCWLMDGTQVESRLPEMVHMLLINLQLFCSECPTVIGA